MIYYFTPFSTGKNLGEAYNHYANLVIDPEDWMCFKDGDVCWLTPDYGQIIEEVISQNPRTGMFTCKTNRVGNKIQCHNEIISENADMHYHIDLALKFANEKRTQVTRTFGVISGHVMIIQKKTWTKIGGAKSGLLGVDNDISRKVLAKNLRIDIMKGIYVWHTYRLKNGILSKTHLV